MKTLVIRRGKKHTIRAIATPQGAGERDKCETLAFFEDCSKNLPAGELDELLALLDDTAESGPPLADTKKYKFLKGTDGIYEFKTHYGLRLFCFWDEGGLIISTHGYVKDTKKTDPLQIDKAERLKKAYFEEKKAGTLIHATPKQK